MNFKERIIRKREEYANYNQVPFEKENDTSNLFRYYETNCRVSQRKEPGDFQRISANQPQLVIREDKTPPRNPIVKNTRYNFDKEERSSQNFTTSMLKSKQPTQQLIKSRLESTRQQINEQILTLQEKFSKAMESQQKLLYEYVEKENHQVKKEMKKSKSEVHDFFNDIVKQINKVIEIQNKKISKGESEQKRRIEEIKNELKAQLNHSLYDLQEKIQRLAINSEKKSKNAGDYSVDIKGSINEMCINNPVQFSVPLSSVDEVRIKDIQESIKSLKLQILQMKTYNQNKTIPSPQPLYTTNRSEMQKEIEFLSSRLKLMEGDMEHQKYLNESKFGEVHRIFKVQEDNIKGMNDQFAKVINTQIIPKLRSIEDEFQIKVNEKIQQTYEKRMKEKLQSMVIISTRQQKQNEKQKLRIKGGVGYKETYMLDEDGYLLDSQGVYLLDEGNQRIKVEEDQIYYLKVQGIEILY